MPILLGIDLGTTRIKAAAFDAGGRQLVAAATSSPLRELVPRRIEQGVEEIRDAAHGVIRQVTGALGGAKREIDALGVTGQMGGITAVDAPGHPLIPYDSPLDLRCAPSFDQHIAPHLSTIIARTGARPQWGQKLLYWRDAHPAIWKRIVKFSTLAGYVASDLVDLPGTEAFIDRTYAAYSGLCADGKEWDPELCALLDVPVEKLPRLIEPGAVIGALSERRAAFLGLPAGLPVIAGVGDGAASLLGGGAVVDGGLFDLSGTATVLAACVARFVPDPHNKILNCVPSAAPGLWNLTYVLFGGQAVRWFAQQFSSAAGVPENLTDRLAWWDARGATVLNEEAGAAPTFLPHLGGRVAPPRPAVKGGWLGVTWDTRPEHLYVAILQAVACEFAMAVRRIHALIPGWHADEVRVIGGGARSAVWNQLKADILGLPHLPLKPIEFAARGVSLIAGAAVGAIADLRATAVQVEAGARVEPRPDRHRDHERALRVYETLTEHVEPLFEALRRDEELGGS